jgi:hypothetical protein
MADEKGYWFTTENGVHIHVEEGETPAQATKRFFGEKKTEFRQNTPYTELTKTENKHIIKEPKELAIKGDAAESLYNDIQSGKRYTYEELLNNSVVKDLEAKANMAMGMALQRPPISDEDKARYTAKFLQGAKNTPKGFRADLVMGLPAAGKSSAVVNSLKSKYGSFEFDNDEIKKLLPGYNEYGAAYVHKDSQAVQNHAFDNFKAGSALNGANLAIPIIGGKKDKVKNWVKDLQAAGYDVHIHHVGISNEESMNRAVGRAISTGRYIPLNTIKNYGEKPKEIYEQLKKENLQEVSFE